MLRCVQVGESGVTCSMREQVVIKKQRGQTLRCGGHVLPEVRKGPGQTDELQLNAGWVLQAEKLSKAVEHRAEPRGSALKNTDSQSCRSSS